MTNIINILQCVGVPTDIFNQKIVCSAAIESMDQETLEARKPFLEAEENRFICQQGFDNLVEAQNKELTPDQMAKSLSCLKILNRCGAKAELHHLHQATNALIAFGKNEQSKTSLSDRGDTVTYLWSTIINSESTKTIKNSTNINLQTYIKVFTSLDWALDTYQTVCGDNETGISYQEYCLKWFAKNEQLFKNNANTCQAGFDILLEEQTQNQSSNDLEATLKTLEFFTINGAKPSIEQLADTIVYLTQGKQDNATIINDKIKLIDFIFVKIPSETETDKEELNRIRSIIKNLTNWVKERPHLNDATKESPALYSITALRKEAEKDNPKIAEAINKCPLLKEKFNFPLENQGNIIISSNNNTTINQKKQIQPI